MGCHSKGWLKLTLPGAGWFGSRPTLDRPAQKIKDLWDAGKFDELRTMESYKSGDFLFTVDPNPTASQQAAEKLFTDASAKLAELQQKHSSAKRQIEQEIVDLANAAKAAKVFFLLSSFFFLLSSFFFLLLSLT